MRDRYPPFGLLGYGGRSHYHDYHAGKCYC